jgi:uncharacterized protein (DUF885 family)
MRKACALFFLLMMTPHFVNGQTSNVMTMNDTERLQKLFADDWAWRMREYPEFATNVGYPGQNDRWTDMSLPAIERRKQRARENLTNIKAINRANLNDSGKLNYDLFLRRIQEDVDGQRFPSELLQINQMGGVQQDVPNTISNMPMFTAKDYENILARLRAVPVLIDQVIVLLNRGLEQQITPPAITLRDVPQQVENLINDDPLQSPFMRTFDKMPERFSAVDRQRLQTEALKIILQEVIPSYRKLHDFLTVTYLPKTRESIGLSALKDGKEWYAYSARVFTTTSMTPEEIHRLGLEEVQRIRDEMGNIIDEIGFKGGFEEFIEFLRNDPQFYYTNADSLLIGYRDICKRADPELAKFFGKLPRTPYGVIPVPQYAEQSQTTAYYNAGSLPVGRPGFFYANTYALNTRPKWEMEALTLHEAVPGHHLQISLAQELEGVPEFRKHEGYTAFVEGWALYAESLGEEMGFYADPVSKFGQLTYEMWRAVRLVVDTGMHVMGWTRQEAIDFFKDNSSKPEHDIVVEIDRYIVWPGQALAYKIGELKIKELRKFASAELGDAFDLRAFHDQVLGNGAVPLEVLEAQVKSWVMQQKTKNQATNR